jgi:hypothetical protein
MELVDHGTGIANVLGASNASFSHIVGFSGNLRSVGDV